MNQSDPNREYYKVEVPDDYYQKELDAYYDWPFAWGREIGQNSIDAGAKNITIKVVEGKGYKKNPESTWSDSTCWIDWADDGIGMDRDDGEGKIVVFSKFLVLGASQKKDGDTGGFGWAKKLICFAMIEWHIRTGSLHIHGEGGTYWVERNLERIEGTQMRIRVPASSYRIKSEITKWLYWTDTKGCKVVMNENEMPTFSSVPVKGTRDIPKLDWAKLTVTEVLGRDIIVRANGQMMSKMSGSEDQKHSVVIEVIGKSKDYFTSNRDSLRREARSEIATFLNRLYRNPNRISVTEKPILSDFNGAKGAIKIGDCPEGLGIDLASLLACGVDLIKLLEGMTLGGGDAVHDGFNIHIHNEMEGQPIPERFLPGTWTKKSIELMAKWCAIIKFVGDVTGYNGPITPGWVFSPDVAAMHKRGHILLNPVAICDKTWVITDRFDNDGAASDWNILVEHAIHEFTHAHGPWNHNSRFIIKMGECVAQILDNSEDLIALRDTFYA